jgi:hypothetical protein
MSTQQTQTITGFLGKEPTFTILEDKKLAVSNFSVGVTTPDGTKWTNCTAWGADAEKMKNLKKGTKLTITGQEKIKEKDGQNYPFLNVKEVTEHIYKKDLEVVIGNIEFKTPKEKELAEITVYHNKTANGVQDNELYKIAAYGKVKDELKASNLKVGDKLTITADGKPYTYEKDGVTKNDVQYTLISFDPGKNKSAEQTSAASKKAVNSAEMGM